jgi:hypothetical protein
MGLTTSMGWKRDALRKREIGKQGDTGRGKMWSWEVGQLSGIEMWMLTSSFH